MLEDAFNAWMLHELTDLNDLVGFGGCDGPHVPFYLFYAMFTSTVSMRLMIRDFSESKGLYD
jgi:hypothetical protein